MSYKLDGAKFPTLEELVEALYPIYSDKMSEEEFKKYAEENAEKDYAFSLEKSIIFFNLYSAAENILVISE